MPGDQVAHRVPSSRCASLGSQEPRLARVELVRARSSAVARAARSADRRRSARSSAEPTTSVAAASRSRSRNAGSSYSGGVDDREARRRTLLPGVAERRAARGRRRHRSRSAVAVTTIAFLPLVSACSRRSGRQPRNISAVACAAGEDHGIDVGVGDQAAARIVVGGRHELQDVAGTPAAQHRSASSRSGRTRLRRRFEDHRVAGGQCRQHPAGRDREREVPRRRHDDGAERRARSRPRPRRAAAPRGA